MTRNGLVGPKLSGYVVFIVLVAALGIGITQGGISGAADYIGAGLQTAVDEPVKALNDFFGRSDGEGEDGDGDGDGAGSGGVCPSTCSASVEVIGDPDLTFGGPGNYRLAFLSHPTYRAINSVSGIDEGCAVWLHRDIQSDDEWYPDDPPEDSITVKKLTEDWDTGTFDTNFVAVAPANQTCRDDLTTIRYKVGDFVEWKSFWWDPSTDPRLHIHPIFSTMDTDAHDYAITLHDSACIKREDTGWDTRSRGWWWHDWTVDGGSDEFQPFQLSIWNRDHSETEPQFTYVGCEPDNAACPADSELGDGKQHCTNMAPPGDIDSGPAADPSFSSISYDVVKDNEMEFTVAVQNNDDDPIRAMVRFEQNDGDVWTGIGESCPDAGGCPVKQIDGGGAAIFHHTTDWKSGYGRDDFEPDFDISLWVRGPDGSYDLVTRENQDCCSSSGGDDGGGGEAGSWDFTINSAEIYRNLDEDTDPFSDVTSDPKAKVTLADGSHAETNTQWDESSPEWDATLFTGKSSGALTALTIDIDDYDRGTWDDDIGECDFNVDGSNFVDGTAFTLTESCGGTFDVTFTISPGG